MAFAVTRDDVNKLNRTLVELLERSESIGCVVCDYSGYVIAQQGTQSYDPTLISALGAGVFAASRELARILGEDNFSSVFHQGERRSIYICSVTADVLLVIIFSNEGSVGLVKLYALPAAKAVAATLEEVRVREETLNVAEHTFVLNENVGGIFSPDAGAQ
jgi:predicted regulator of Ras-like GTPase activity (Roadblock/LC7/MglB family)